MTDPNGTRCTCGSGCLTFGECIRRKSINVGYCREAAGWDLTNQKRWDRELASYRAARAQGIEPEGTRQHQIDKAVRISNERQEPFIAGNTI